MFPKRPLRSALSAAPPLRFRFQNARRWLRPLGFVLVNVWLVYHLVGIVLAPWSVPPASRLVQNAFWAVEAYDEALFLNHGYHYFAPQPGDSTAASPTAGFGRDSCITAISC
jgi:hypothetical protein